MNIPSNINRIIVDGSNIAFATRVGKKADIRNLELLLTKLRELQIINPELSFEIICDANLKYIISDPKKYENWVQRGTIRQAPPQFKADEIIIDLMIKFDGEIILITNDLYREYDELNQLKSRHQYGFVFAFGEIIFKKMEFKSNLVESIEEVNDMAEISL